jgi:invasion protein IalB
MSMRRLQTGLILATTLGTILAAGQVAAQGATVAGTFGGWNLYTSNAGATMLCFIAAPPTERKPPNANRATTLFYVSAWPKDGIRSEVSVKLGYPIKPASDVTVAVGKDTFKLFPKDERAFVADATEELKLIEALKKGSEVDVSAVSARGTATTDTYSLTGVKQALQALATACP